MLHPAVLENVTACEGKLGTPSVQVTEVGTSRARMQLTTVIVNCAVVVALVRVSVRVKVAV